MQDLGLLRWDQRLVRDGWRVEQTSNAYELVPNAAVPGDGRPANVPVIRGPRTGGQTGRPTQRIESSYFPQFTAAEIQTAQAALAQRRAVIEARLLGNKSALATA